MALPAFTINAADIWPATAIDADKAEIRQWALEVERALNAAFTRYPMMNGQLDVTVAANVLTVAIKTVAGADPSAADPVYISFRDVDQTEGAEVVIAVTGANSFIISAGSLVGGIDTEAMRLQIVAFNDGSTVRLGVINCFEDGIIHKIDESVLESSTAEGGAGGADSAGVIYTGSAVTNKAMRLLGHMTWEANALATAGLYGNVPDIVQLMGPGVHRPGDVVQRKRTRTSAVDTTGTATLVDDTIPQLSSDGETQLSRTITPVSRANVIAVSAEMQLANDAIGEVTSALHQDSIENALTAHHASIAAANDSVLMRLDHQYRPLTVSEITLKINNGPTSGTLTLNGVNGTRTFGGVNYSRLLVEEIFA